MDFAVPCFARANRPHNFFSRTLVARTACMTLMVVFTTLPLLAQSPNYPDFTSVAGLSLNGNAAQLQPNILRLNPALTGQVGAAWFTTLQPVSEGFSTTFTFQITPPTPSDSAPPFPADGIAFVIQNSALGLKAIGQGGGAIGYGSLGDLPGIDNSVAIEFDTFANQWDVIEGINASNHIAVQSCGPNSNSADHGATYVLNDVSVRCNFAIATAPVTLSDGNPHTVTIEYNPPAIILLAAFAQAPPPPGLQVTIDGTPVFASPVQIDLGSVLNLANPTDTTADSAYVGFTGATGALAENNDILSWTFTSHGSQTITQNNLPANTFTTYNFGSYLYKVRPNQNIATLAVTEVPTDPNTFNAGGNFPTAQCIVYDHTGGKCVEFHASCTGATCSNVNYDVVTSYDVPAGSPAITNPGFLKATGLDCAPGITFDSNIITFFSQTRIDPTTKGSSKPTFSCFVATQGQNYLPADVDIANVASPKVVTGSTLTYLIPVANFGPNAAQGVTINDTLPAGTTYVSSGLCSLTSGCSAFECSSAAGAVSCSAGSMDPFSVQVMVVVVRVTAPGGSVLKNTATVTEFNPDPRPVDNAATATTLVVSKKY